MGSGVQGPSTETDVAQQVPARGRTRLPSWLAAVLILAVAAISFLLRLGATPITSPNEGLYAEAAREMLEGHDFVVPHINSVIYFEKPPLLYWLSAASMAVFGVNAMAARLPSALAGMASVWFVFLLGGALFGRRRAGTVPALVLATSVGFVIMARQVMFDALLCATMTASLVLFWLGTERRSRGLVCGMYAALALGVLAKGLMGLFLPGMVVVAYCAVARDWTRLRLLANPVGLALFLALAVPWHVAAALRYHEFTWFYFYNEHVLRFLGTRWPYDFPRQSVTSPTVGVIYLAMPWSLLFPALGYHLVSLRWRGIRARPELIFMLCWALVPLAFFTMAQSRIYYYMLPAVPPFVLLFGSLWATLTEEGANPRRLRVVVSASLVISFVLVFGAWLWASSRITGTGQASDRAALAFVGCFPLVVGFAAAATVALMGRMRVALACLAAGTALTLAVASVAVTRWPAGDSLQQMAELTNHRAAVGDPIVAVDDRLEKNSSFLFYLSKELRPIRVVEGREGGDLEFGSRYPDAGRLFLSGDDLRRLAVTRRVVFLTDDPPRAPLPPGFHPIMRYRTDVLWANFTPLASFGP